MVKQQKDLESNRGNLFKLPRNQAIFAGVGLLMVVVLALFFVFRGGGLDNLNIAMRVGDTVVYNDEYKEFIRSAKDFNLEEEDARQTLIDYHKNKIILDEMGVPFNDTILDAQWKNVLIDIFQDYDEILENEDKGDSVAARALSLDSYISLLGSEQPGEIYVGALYHLPYYEQFKESELEFANSVREAAVAADSSLEEVASYIDKNLKDYPHAGSSYTGLYLLKTDASATMLGGAFGSRNDLIPQSLLAEMTQSEPPFVSELFDDQIRAFFMVHTTDSFELVEFFVDKIKDAQNRIKVVEYDR